MLKRRRKRIFGCYSKMVDSYNTWFDTKKGVEDNDGMNGEE